MTQLNLCSLCEHASWKSAMNQQFDCDVYGIKKGVKTACPSFKERKRLCANCKNRDSCDYSQEIYKGVISHLKLAERCPSYEPEDDRKHCTKCKHEALLISSTECKVCQTMRSRPNWEKPLTSMMDYDEAKKKCRTCKHYVQGTRPISCGKFCNSHNGLKDYESKIMTKSEAEVKCKTCKYYTRGSDPMSCGKHCFSLNNLACYKPCELDIDKINQCKLCGTFYTNVDSSGVCKSCQKIEGLVRARCVNCGAYSLHVGSNGLCPSCFMEVKGRQPHPTKSKCEDCGQWFPNLDSSGLCELCGKKEVDKCVTVESKYDKAKRLLDEEDKRRVKIWQEYRSMLSIRFSTKHGYIINPEFRKWFKQHYKLPYKHLVHDQVLAFDKDEWKLFEDMFNAIKEKHPVYKLELVQKELCRKTNCYNKLMDKDDKRCSKCNSKIKLEGKYCSTCGAIL